MLQVPSGSLNGIRIFLVEVPAGHPLRRDPPATGGVGDSTPATAARQEGRIDPCRGPGGASEPMAEGRETGQSLADRTRQ
jgi:hypothetical protein